MTRLMPFAVLLAAGTVWSAPIFFVGTASREFGRLDAATGAFTSIGTTTATSVGLGAATSGSPYFVDDVSNLSRVNTANAALTAVGPTGQSLSVASSLSPGALFAIDYANQLFSINAATGAATLIGPTGIPALDPSDIYNNALAGDGTNLYYLYQVSGTNNIASSLYRINTATGAATLIGLTGASTITAAAFGDGVLYAFTNSGRQILSVNTGTGAATLVTTYNGQTRSQIWAAVQDVPEPATGLLIAGCLAALALRSRKSPLA